MARVWCTGKGLFFSVVSCTLSRYWSYEIQVSVGTRGLGLGRTLVGFLEAIGGEYEIEKIMLTVLKGDIRGRSDFRDTHIQTKANERALKFYKQHGYANPQRSRLTRAKIRFQV